VQLARITRLRSSCPLARDQFRPFHWQDYIYETNAIGAFRHSSHKLGIFRTIERRIGTCQDFTGARRRPFAPFKAKDLIESGRNGDDARQPFRNFGPAPPDIREKKLAVEG
jgi:hypothetical protein